jgi:hypothetical protein
VHLCDTHVTEVSYLFFSITCKQSSTQCHNIGLAVTKGAVVYGNDDIDVQNGKGRRESVLNKEPCQLAMPPLGPHHRGGRATLGPT